jgi:hypothetical protein
VLRAAVLAGVIASVAASAFHVVLAEPLIERAIEQEAQTKKQHGARLETPLVSRAMQRQGLVIGLLVYGVVWGALVGVVFVVVERRRQLWALRSRAWPLAMVIGWAVAWFPFLKYPTNPPGVGDSTTVAYRQLLYVGFVVLSAAGTAVAFLVRGQRSSSRPRAVMILYAAYAVALYAAMPRNPDPITMPADLVWSFRGISFAGLVLFWLALGVSFHWLVRERA